MTMTDELTNPDCQLLSEPAELELLRESLGCDLSLIRYSPDRQVWQSNPETLPQIVGDAVSLGLLCTQALQAGFAIEASSDSILICLKLGDEASRTEFALGILESGDVVLAEKLGGLAVRLMQQQLQIVQQEESLLNCLEQLTYSFEEQSWVRTLTKCMKACAVERKLEEVLHEIVPSIQSLTCSAAVGFLPIPEPLSPLPSVRWSGLECGTAQLWLGWISQVQARFSRGPVIQNGPAVSAELSNEGIDSVCVAPVTHGQRNYGWIIAINRHGGSNWLAPSPINLTWDDEFTTVEAGLIEAACGMFAAQISNHELLQDREDLILGIIRSMSAALDSRDPYTRGHSERVARYAQRLARRLGIDVALCNRIYMAGLMHDIGKIGVPDFALQKKGKLTDEEFALIKKHPDLGAIIIDSLPQLSDLKPGVLHHHERIDGRGYPAGLKGNEIPQMARILAIADTYDALTSNRPYRDGMSDEKARCILQEGTGSQWDAQMIAEFLQISPEELAEDAHNSNKNGWQTDEFSLRSAVAGLPRNLATDYHRALLYAGDGE